MTTYKDHAYLAYRDQGVIILDISDLTKPTKISQIKWPPPEEGNTHSIGVVIPSHGGRPDIILATDEITSAKQCPFGYLHVLDVPNRFNEIPKSGRVVLYCDCKPYDIADRAVFLEYRGYRNIFIMPEGYSGWVKRGYPLENARR